MQVLTAVELSPYCLTRHVLRQVLFPLRNQVPTLLHVLQSVCLGPVQVAQAGSHLAQPCWAPASLRKRLKSILLRPPLVEFSVPFEDPGPEGAFVSFPGTEELLLPVPRVSLKELVSLPLKEELALIL